MAEQIDLVEIDLKPLLKDTELLTDNITELETANKRLRSEMSKQKGETVESLNARKELNAQILDNTEKLKDLKKQRTINNKLLKAEAGSITQLKAAQQKLIEERQKLNINTKEGAERLKEIKAELRSNQDAINEASDGFANYTGNMEKLVENTNNSSEGLSVLTDKLDSAGVGVSGLVGKLKAFLKNPYVAIFAAIAGAIVAIGNAMKNSRAGSVLMQKGMADIAAGVDVTKKRVNDFVEGIVTSEKPVGNAAKKYGKALLGIPLLKFAKDVATGEKKVKDIGKAFNEERKEIAETRKELIELNDAFIDIENELLTIIATQRSYAEVQRAIADADTRSFQETRAAAEEAAKADKIAAEANVKLSQERLRLAEAEIELGIKQGYLRRTASGEIISIKKTGIELEKAYTEAKIASIEAEGQLLATTVDNRQRADKLKQDEAEQEIDFIKDIAEAQTAINLTQIADTRNLYSERVKIHKDTKKLVEESYDDQLALYEREYGVQIDRAKLANLNNKEIYEYARGLELSEIMSNVLRDVTITRRQAVQDLIDAEKALNEEYLERQATAARIISEAEKAELEAEAGTIEKIKELRLAWAEEEYLHAISNKELIDSEKIALEIQYQKEVSKINEEAVSARIKEEEKAAKEKEKIMQDSLNFSTNALGSFVQNSQIINDSNRKREVEAAGENEEAIAAINEKYSKKQKKADLAVATANIALSIIKAYSQLGPIAATAASALLLSTLGAQLAKIRNTDYFEHGGEVKSGVFKGSSHANGGIDLYTGSGQHVANVEGNEGFYVINKHDNPEAIQKLSEINSRHGRAFAAPVRYAQQGGEVAAGNENQGLLEEMLSKIKIFVDVVDINNAQATYAKVVNKGKV